MIAPAELLQADSTVTLAMPAADLLPWADPYIASLFAEVDREPALLRPTVEQPAARVVLRSSRVAFDTVPSTLARAA